MEAKVLIFHDVNKESDFFTKVDTVAERANALCNIFESFQSWKRITTLEEFEWLIRDPAAAFDEVLTKSVKISVEGDIPVVPEQLALMLGIDRVNYMNILEGRIVTSDCTACKKIRYKQVPRVITVQEYEKHKAYLTFTSGGFIADEAALEASQERFRVYAETPKQLDILKHWEELVRIINEHDKRYGFNTTDKVIMSKAFHLLLSRGMEGEFQLNKEYIKNDILKLQYSERQ